MSERVKPDQAGSCMECGARVPLVLAWQAEYTSDHGPTWTPSITKSYAVAIARGGAGWPRPTGRVRKIVICDPIDVREATDE